MMKAISDPSPNQQAIQQLSAKMPSPSIPEEYKDDSRVKGKLLFVLPPDLIVLLKREIEDQLSEDAWHFEEELSAACPRPYVGFWGGSPIAFGRLHLSPNSDNLPKATRYDLENLEAFKEVHDPTESQLAEYYEILARVGNGVDVEALRQPTLAYAGWLATNPTFQREHRDFFDKHTKLISELGSPVLAVKPLFVGDSDSKVFETHYAVSDDPEAIAFTKDFEEFCVKWRLEGMTAPYLPNPAQFVQGTAARRTALGHLARPC